MDRFLTLRVAGVGPKEDLCSPVVTTATLALVSMHQPDLHYAREIEAVENSQGYRGDGRVMQASGSTAGLFPFLVLTLPQRKQQKKSTGTRRT